MPFHIERGALERQIAILRLQRALAAEQSNLDDVNFRLTMNTKRQACVNEWKYDSTRGIFYCDKCTGMIANEPLSSADVLTLRELEYVDKKDGDN